MFCKLEGSQVKGFRDGWYECFCLGRLESNILHLRDYDIELSTPYGTSFPSQCSMSYVYAVLGNGALLSVFREQSFVLAIFWVLWEFPLYSLGQNSFECTHVPALGASRGHRRWPVEILFSLFLVVLIRITFIDSRKFHCTRFPQHQQQMPPTPSPHHLKPPPACS